jgi:hypothetical protein
MDQGAEVDLLDIVVATVRSLQPHVVLPLQESTDMSLFTHRSNVLANLHCLVGEH